MLTVHGDKGCRWYFQCWSIMGEHYRDKHISLVQAEENIESLVKKVDAVGVFIDVKKISAFSLQDIPHSCRQNCEH